MVSGSLGDSALALQMLREGQTPAAELLARHHRPTAQIELGRQMAERGLARAMIDISDGLAGDLEHILQASRVDGVIDEELLPLSTAFRRATEGRDALRQFTLYGGEDYELLFTVPPDRIAEVAALGVQLQLSITRIGIIQEGSGRLSLRDGTGAIHALQGRGYDHFCHT
jgi:thiamine-monophosphate kinase